MVLNLGVVRRAQSRGEPRQRVVSWVDMVRYHPHHAGMTRGHPQAPPQTRSQDNAWSEWLIAGFAGIVLFLHVLLWWGHVQPLP